MSYDAYNVLQYGLHAGCLRVVDPLELLHPQQPPEDEEWPAPQVVYPRRHNGHNRREARNEALRVAGQPTSELLARLAPLQAWLCALTAAEMVLPAWFGYAAVRRLKASQRLAPHVALRNARRWLAGQYRLTDLLDCAEAIGFTIREVSAGNRGRGGWHPAHAVGDAYLHGEPPRRAPVQAARSALGAVAAATYLRGAKERDSKTRHWLHQHHDSGDGLVHLATEAVLYAAQVTPVSPAVVSLRSSAEEEVARHPNANAFLAYWWRRCRCRLAFADAPGATIEFVR